MPDYAADAHPVETNCAIRESNCHLHRHAAEAFSSVMVTCGNGALCSKLLFNAINRACVRKIKACCSMEKEKNSASPTLQHLEKMASTCDNILQWVKPCATCMMLQHRVRRTLGASVTMIGTFAKSKASHAQACLPRITLFRSLRTTERAFVLLQHGTWQPEQEKLLRQCSFGQLKQKTSRMLLNN